MKDTPNKPRFRIRTVLIVVAPSAIFVVGGWLAGIAGFVLSQDSFLPNLLIMFGGTVIFVTVALAVCVFMDRPDGTGLDSGDWPSVENEPVNAD